MRTRARDLVINGMNVVRCISVFSLPHLRATRTSLQKPRKLARNAGSNLTTLRCGQLQHSLQTKHPSVQSSQRSFLLIGPVSGSNDPRTTCPAHIIPPKQSKKQDDAGHTEPGNNKICPLRRLPSSSTPSFTLVLCFPRKPFRYSQRRRKVKQIQLCVEAQARSWL